MALSEIEKLERRYAENPQGLTFAPLAEVHRKNGDTARALELLRPGLSLHPDYIPASIVLGRCHLDLGDLPAAEAAFTHVLALDGENVIALKSLADITERLFRFDEAERWLRTLLAIDRSNDDARDQLGRVETARRQAEAASSAAPDAALADTPAAAESADEASATRTETAPTMSAPPPLPDAPRDAMLDWVSQSDSASADEAVPLALEELDLSVESEPPPEGIELEQPVTLEEPVEPLAGIVGLSDSQRDAIDLDPLDSLEVSEEFQVETAEDIVLQSSGGSEFQVANASEELLTSRGSGLTEPPPSPMAGHERSPLDADVSPSEAEQASSEPVPEPASTPAAAEYVPPPPMDRAAPWAAPVVEPPRRVEADLLVTESMAELLAEQGHAAEALTVYRHLESRNAGESRFAERIAELEHTAAKRAPEPAGAAEPVPPPALEPPRPAYSVLETQGQSVQAFLRGVFGTRLAAGSVSSHPEPARATAADPDGAPTRPAHDSLSLSSVFGDESTPTPPAVSAAGGGGQGGVSYDEFFGAPGASTTPRPPRAPDSKSDDLDQFHAWLQNLKR
jgi:tetratricopeptide (TPR) repeat protein